MNPEGESPREVIAEYLFRTQVAWMGQMEADFDSVEDALPEADSILAALSDAGYTVAKLVPVMQAFTGEPLYRIRRDPEGTETPQ